MRGYISQNGPGKFRANMVTYPDLLPGFLTEHSMFLCRTVPINKYVRTRTFTHRTTGRLPRIFCAHKQTVWTHQFTHTSFEARKFFTQNVSTQSFISHKGVEIRHKSFPHRQFYTTGSTHKAFTPGSYVCTEAFTLRKVYTKITRSQKTKFLKHRNVNVCMCFLSGRLYNFVHRNNPTGRNINTEMSR